MSFLNKNSYFNKSLESIKDLQTPPKFCPFRSENLKCQVLGKYRLIDGSCNNLKEPLWGKSSTPYKRYLEPEYDDGNGSPRKKSVSGQMLPNPRYIAMNVHRPNDASSMLSNLGGFLMNIYLILYNIVS